ncbi:molybdopterin-guanine dinucleotide biosynthesis protein B [Stigmatella aurantiaca]|uniref:Molybdopterin-guanine dinucleotide biosynthesis protein B n=1 Tax=Stigmatella aurantiaca (strain DW4/3-1) TaxID=378806 RepID=Q098I1_STIAD|nr:molybdopterin-guanine dinucleotide biosynthesis protein B [Stigmatella aurantiaca]ADO68107.1 Molybdopterin-guanine dinucleotide biosynthesis protein B [Stigmatella aurantiaca DW4/3-1]EAU68159.1 molybdopterin-guanine dinucleotide biosynthesis protein B [Stigmatella aurantiaca DW4/3-1]
MRAPPAVSIIGGSGMGKTTLLERLLPALRDQGLRVGVVKHSSDPHPLHREHSDTARFERAEAAFVAFATPAGVQLTVREEPSRALLPLLARFGDTVDLVLVEGWKNGPLPKLEVWREGQGPLLAASRPDVVAIVTDARELPAEAPPEPRRFGLEEVQGLAMFIARLARERTHVD